VEFLFWLIDIGSHPIAHQMERYRQEAMICFVRDKLLLQIFLGGPE